MLRTIRIPLAIVILSVAGTAMSQEPGDRAARGEAFQSQTGTGQVATSGVVTPTVEMWFYEQEQRRRDDTKLAIRRRAEARADQRQARLAATRWYGISNSRPTVSPTPVCYGYSAYWGSNSFDPLRWNATAPMVVVRPTDRPY
jgi:hypothetical protein